MLDVSVAAQSWHSEDGTKRVARGDLLMDVGIPPTGRWFPGEKYSVTLKILVDRAPNRLDDVVSEAHIKGHLPKPGETVSNSGASADPVAGGNNSGAPSAAWPAGSKMPTGPYPVFDPASNDVIGSANYLLPLLYLRNTPGVLNDISTLQSFIALASCKGVSAAELRNEFGDTPLATFYRDNAAKILSNVPSKITEQIPAKLGEYDFSAGAFPINISNDDSHLLNHVDIYGRFSLLKQCAPSGGSSRFELLMNGGRFYYQVTLSPIILEKVVMDQASAKSYIEQHLNRQVTIVFTVEVSGDAPRVIEGSGRRLEPTVSFAGRTGSISIYDNYPNGKVIAVIDPGKGAPPRAEGGRGAEPAPGSSSASAPSSNATATASPTVTGGPSATIPATLPVPVVHDGVAGKVLMGFVEKCSAGDSKGCEMVGFDLERGWGADKDPQAAKAYYQKACSMGRKNDCGR